MSPSAWFTSLFADFLYNLISSDKRIETMQRCANPLFRSTNYTSFNAEREKPPIELKINGGRQKRSKSSLYRNRSLKQFFGDIPAISEYAQINDDHTPYQPKERAKRNPIKITCQDQTKGKQTTADEYLIKHKERFKSKRKENQQANHERQSDRYKRKHIAHDEQAADSTNNTNKIQTKTEYYDPRAYQWRKTSSKSKEKQEIKNDKKSKGVAVQNLRNSTKDSEIVQSEYYGTPNTSQNAERKVNNDRLRQERQLMRSSSTESLKKQRHPNLRPKVVKHIFEIKSPRQKHHSLSLKKNLLFTFGI